MISPFRPLLGCVFAFSAFAGDAGGRPGEEALRKWPQWRGPLTCVAAPVSPAWGSSA